MLVVAGRVVDAARLAEICDAYGIAELVLFGSAASGTAGPASDVDLLYALRQISPAASHWGREPSYSAEPVLSEPWSR